MLIISLIVWLGLFIGLAAVLNKLVKVPFFNGAYVFLFMAAIAAPFQVLATWDAGAYQAAGAAIGAWITSFAVAYWLGSKFVAEHPFSFPSILWKRKSAPVSAAPAANAEQPEEQAPVITPSWMKENKPWWKR